MFWLWDLVIHMLLIPVPHSLLLLFWFIAVLDNVYLVGLGNDGAAKLCCTFLIWTTTYFLSFNLNEKTSRLLLWGYRWPTQCVITKYSSLAYQVLPWLRGKYSELQPSIVVMWSFVMKKHPFFLVKHYPHSQFPSIYHVDLAVRMDWVSRLVWPFIQPHVGETAGCQSIILHKGKVHTPASPALSLDSWRFLKEYRCVDCVRVCESCVWGCEYRQLDTLTSCSLYSLFLSLW